MPPCAGRRRGNAGGFLPSSHVSSTCDAFGAIPAYVRRKRRARARYETSRRKRDDHSEYELCERDAERATTKVSSTAPCPAQVYDVTVRNSVVRSEKCNALQIGSETVGNMSKISFSNISILGAAKAGIGIVSMDGSHVRDVTYDAIRMTDVQAVAFVMLGARLRRPYIPKLTQVVDEWIGSISNVVVRGVTATRVGAPNRWKQGRKRVIFSDLSRLVSRSVFTRFDSFLDESSSLVEFSKSGPFP